MKKIFLLSFCVFIGKFMFSQEIEKIKIIQLQKIIAENKKPVIVNFWATWCPPCAEQFVDLFPEVEKYAADSIHFILVSLNFENEIAQISEYIRKRKISAHVLWLDETDQEYYCPKIDPTWSGAFPATLLINNKTKYRYFSEDIMTKEMLEKQIAALVR
ncbi:MAG: TlpA family protein disulfide reductase [Chitinophagaceae bacterium]|nr:TlpA family protein disulfide reductase [Chitinophagaceae bacterium]